jgi:hypothetical protein
LKNAVDWLSRLENPPFKDKPIAIQSATGGPLGGSRVQYQWRQVFVFLDAHVMTRPEVFAGLAQNKFDDKLELKDQPTIDFVKMQLTAFEKYIRKLSGKISRVSRPSATRLRGNKAYRPPGARRSRHVWRAQGPGDVANEAIAASCVLATWALRRSVEESHPPTASLTNEESDRA